MAGAEPQDGVGAQCLELVPCPGCAEVSSWQQELVSPSWHHQLLPPKPVPEQHVPPGLHTGLQDGLWSGTLAHKRLL